MSRRGRRIAGERRIAAQTTLAADHGIHKAGAPVTWVSFATVTDLGRVAYAVPWPSELLLHAAEVRLSRAKRLRNRLLRTSRALKDGTRSLDDKLALEFFEEAMAGIALAYAGLNAFASEELPEGFAMVKEDGSTVTRHDLVSGGLEWRLSRALSQATGRPNIRDSQQLWSAFVSLKSLRDAVDHAAGGPNWHNLANEPDQVFARLLGDLDLPRHGQLVRVIIDSYRPRRGEAG